MNSSDLSLANNQAQVLQLDKCVFRSEVRIGFVRFVA
jgi:hypothetical protein